MLRFANPTLFLQLVRWLLPLMTGLSVALLAYGLFLVFNTAPDDYQQGATVKIMYIHVPAAWLGLACYSMMALSSIGSLVWKHPLADVSAKALAPIGAAFTFLCLVTGALWGKPMWGTWWVWDARLTSVLVLFLVYCGIMALWTAFDDPARAARPVAILTLFGFINVPIVKFSVDWWNTLHQPASVFRMGGPSIDPSMLLPLFVMAAGATAMMVALHLIGMRTEIIRRRVRNLSQQLVQRESFNAPAHEEDAR
jgi:heme exporter protein C